MDIAVVRVEQKAGGAHFVHWLSDGRYVLETRGSGGNTRWGPWALFLPQQNRPTQGKHQHSASSLRTLLKWAEKNPPR